MPARKRRIPNMNTADSESTGAGVMDRPQIIVSRDGSGSHRTIGEAISAAVPGDTIKIHSGVYEEALIIERPVTLVGDPNGLVLIHNPRFTAMNIRRTEVILENLAFGVSEEQMVLAGDGSKIQMLNCLVESTDVLLRSSDSVTASITKAHTTFDKAPDSVGVPRDAVAAKGCSLFLVGCLFRAAKLKSAESQMDVNNTSFQCGAIHVSEKSALNITESRFQCGHLDPVISITTASTSRFSHARFHGINGKAIHAIDSQLIVEDCQFQGTLSIDRDPVPDTAIPANSFLMSAVAIPQPFVEMEAVILRNIEKQGDSSVERNARLLAAINAHNGSRSFPSYLGNSVAKKMLWEYRKKFRTLVYPRDGSNTPIIRIDSS
jgi:hypothetical protein